MSYLLGCQTISGPDLNKPCKFPFIYQGKEYLTCTSVDNGDQPWCSTEVNYENHFIKTKWGNCRDSCFSPKGKTTNFNIFNYLCIFFFQNINIKIYKYPI